MLKIFISTGGAAGQETDYTRYVISNSISITRSLNTPSTCTIALSNYDSAFVMPALRCYVRIWSEQYKKNLFTGFLTNDPTRTFVALGNGSSTDPTVGQQLFAFGLQLTSDEYMLNIKSVPFLPAFVNQSQGFILRSIAEALMPGYFDFTYVVSGDLVPYLQYDPQTSWSELAKQFGDASRFRYSAIQREIHFQPYGDSTLGIDYDETKNQGTFSAADLTTSAMTTPIVNDVTIVGQQEAGNNHEDFFIGDGFNGAFPLKHQAFGLATAAQGSSILINEPWSATQLNTQYWNAQDPSQNFFYGVNNTQSLNVLTGLPQLAGTSFIASLNAIELAGGLSLQHGEFVFNDLSDGIVGGIYDSTILNGFNDLSLTDNMCEAGFRIAPTTAVLVTASGASGIAITPFRQGAFVDKAFTIITKVNKSYVLTTNIVAPKATRYTQIYRSMAGSVFGNLDQPTVSGNITWSCTETDLFTGFQTTSTFTLQNQPLPVTAIYVPINNFQLNLNVTSTQVTTPIPASLNIKCEIGAGLLAPIYISGNVQYTGGFVSPSGGNLPIAPSGIGPENNFALGTSLQNQAAELDSGQVTSTLNFYGDDLPGVGTRIRIQSWESQAAIARLRDTNSVAIEAAIVGDDGVRSSIVTDLSPLPRTSEDCENAAQAFLYDRTGVFYQGTYNASWYFLNQQSDAIDFYPICGRYLVVNAPSRNLNKEYLLVTAVTTNVSELAGEIMTHSIQFGPDLYLEKLLASLIPTNTNVLTNLDTSIQPPVQELLTLGTTFYSDPNQATLTGVSGAHVTLLLLDPVPLGAHYEVRSSDQNWGLTNVGLLLASGVTGTFNLNRSSFDQTWFIRFVSTVPPVGATLPQLSRRAKVLRVAYPRVPTEPAFLYIDSLNMNFDFTGDIRNIEGIELRSGSGINFNGLPATGGFGFGGKSGFVSNAGNKGKIVYYQGIVGSQQDMALDMTTLRGQNGPGQPTIGPIGSYQQALVPANARNFFVFFFNLMWEYGPGLSVFIPAPAGPALSIGFKFSAALQIIDTPTDPIVRSDYKSSEIQVATDSAFANIVVDVTQQGNPGTTIVTVPTTGDLWVRMAFSDYISSGGWSSTLHVPNKNLISSTYLNGQGSVPPVLSSQVGSAGGIFAYESVLNSGGGGTIEMDNLDFGVVLPDGSVIDVIPESYFYTQCLDAPPQIQPMTQYGFFPTIDSLYPTQGGPNVQFNGPYNNFSSTNLPAFQHLFSDGTIALVNGPFVITTGAATTTSGGGGGGTTGGGNCGILSSIIELADGTSTTLAELELGARVRTLSAEKVYVNRKDILEDVTLLLITKSGYVTRAGLAHVVKVNDKWVPFAEIYDRMLEKEHLYVETLNGLHDRIVSISHPRVEKICHIYLTPVDKTKETDDDHVYVLDGVWSHNILNKVQVHGL